MDRLIKILRERLVEKGLELNNIPAFIRNVANSITVNPYASLTDLNRRLHLLGWDDIDLDDYILQLIIASFESNHENGLGFYGTVTYKLSQGEQQETAQSF